MLGNPTIFPKLSAGGAKGRENLPCSSLFGRLWGSWTVTGQFVLILPVLLMKPDCILEVNQQTPNVSFFGPISWVGNRRKRLDQFAELRSWSAPVWSD